MVVSGKLENVITVLWQWQYVAQNTVMHCPLQ